MKAIYKFYFSYGRSGDLEGVFVADKKKVEFLIENKIGVYFGEVLGKHSEVYGNLGEGNFTFITEDPVIVCLFEDFDLSTGHNPLNYYHFNFDFEQWGIEETDEELNTILEQILYKNEN